MKEWNITWDCLITLIRGGGGDCDTDEAIKLGVAYYLYYVFGLELNYKEISSMKIRKYKVYVNVKYEVFSEDED